MLIDGGGSLFIPWSSLPKPLPIPANTHCTPFQAIRKAFNCCKGEIRIVQPLAIEFHHLLTQQL